MTIVFAIVVLVAFAAVLVVERRRSRRQIQNAKHIVEVMRAHEWDERDVVHARRTTRSSDHLQL